MRASFADRGGSWVLELAQAGTGCQSFVRVLAVTPGRPPRKEAGLGDDGGHRPAESPSTREAQYTVKVSAQKTRSG